MSDPDNVISPEPEAAEASARRSSPKRRRDLEAAGADAATDRDGLAPEGRRAAILRAVVAEHIETGQPVGSHHVSGGLGVSPATVRNEMSVLEREGFLTHPHTSAGRVPTDSGYRFFVNSLPPRASLAPGKVAQVREFFDHAHGELEQMLTDTSRLLSQVTDYAAVVVAPPHEVAHIRSVQVVGLGPGPQRSSVALAVVVLSNGAIDKHTIEVSDAITDQQLNAATAHLSAHLVGSALTDLSQHSVLPRTGVAEVDLVCELVLRALGPGRGEDDSGVFMVGASRMAVAFDAVETIRTVLGVLERQYVVVSLLRDALERVASVSIGTEHGSAEVFEALTACSVVVAPYHVDGRRAGTIGVLGPTRMNYPEAMAAVAAVSDRLSQRLTEG